MNEKDNKKNQKDEEQTKIIVKKNKDKLSASLKANLARRKNPINTDI